MARFKSVAAAVAAVIALPGAAALAGFLLVPDASPPNVPAVVRIGESPPPVVSGSTSLPTTTTPPAPPPPPVDDGDDDGPDDDGDSDDG